MSHLRIIRLVLWGASTTLLALGLLVEAPTSAPRFIGTLAAIAYVVALIAALVRSTPHAAELPALDPMVRWPRSYAPMLGLVVAVACVGFVLTGVVTGNGWNILWVCLIGGLAVIVARRKSLHRRTVLGGLAAGAILFSLEFLVDFSPGKAIYMAVIGTTVYIAGAGLLEASQLTRFHLAKGRVWDAVKSLSWGCILAVPPALLNLSLAVGKEPSRFEQTLHTWWSPLYALQPAILEEGWARLFLTTAIYVLLRPLTNDRPGRAIAAAIVISTFIHGAAHYPSSIANPMAAVFITVMYGIPLALLFVRRSLEHAVAYHFLINFVRFLAVATTGAYSLS